MRGAPPLATVVLSVELPFTMPLPAFQLRVTRKRIVNFCLLFISSGSLRMNCCYWWHEYQSGEMISPILVYADSGPFSSSPHSMSKYIGPVCELARAKVR